MSGKDSRVFGGFLAGAVACLAMSLSGCGFEPLYADRSGDSGVVGHMATVRVAPISDRPGQILRNELVDRLNPGGEPADPRYLLEVTITVARQKLGIRRDETATRANMRFSAAFRLRESGSGAIVYSSRAGAVSSYNIVASEYGTIVSERAARRRGLVLVAERISTRLSAFFNRLQSLRRRP